MKYTQSQAARLKNKGLNGYTRHNRFVPDVEIKDGFFIVESKMNYEYIDVNKRIG